MFDDTNVPSAPRTASASQERRARRARAAARLLAGGAPPAPDPVRLASVERRALVRAPGETDLRASAALPPLPRAARPGPQFFSSGGVLDVLQGKVGAEALQEAVTDAAFLLSDAYRPGAEEVMLVTWVRMAGEPRGPTPVFDPTVRGYPVADLAMVVIGYTGTPADHLDGRDAGMQAVLVVAPVALVDGVPVAQLAYAYDATARPKVREGAGTTRLDAAHPVLAALGAVMAYNYADTVRRHAARAAAPAAALADLARYGAQDRAALGPVSVALVEGGPGSPAERAYVLTEGMPADAHERVQPGDVLLSFAHLGPVAYDRGIPPTVGVAPWAVVPGNVYDVGTGALYGGVAYGDPCVEARSE